MKFKSSILIFLLLISVGTGCNNSHGGRKPTTGSVSGTVDSGSGSSLKVASMNTHNQFPVIPLIRNNNQFATQSVPNQKIIKFYSVKNRKGYCLRGYVTVI